MWPGQTGLQQRAARLQVLHSNGRRGNGDDIAFGEGDVGGEAAALENLGDVDFLDDALLVDGAHHADVGEVGLVGDATGTEDNVDESGCDSRGNAPRARLAEFAGEINERAVVNIGALLA